MDWDEVPLDFMTSTVTGIGRDEIVKYIREVNQEIKKQ